LNYIIISSNLLNFFLNKIQYIVLYILEYEKFFLVAII